MSRPLTSRDRLLLLLGSPARTVVIVLIFALILLNRLFVSPAMPPPPLDSHTAYTVERTIDGDTLLLQNGTRVRLIGIDAPDLPRDDLPAEPLALEAARWLDEQARGNAVRLEFDLERYDRDDRTFAYVYLDDVLLNEASLRRGFSRAQRQANYSARMKKRFQAAEAEAQAHQRGIWGTQPSGLPEP